MKISALALAAALLIPTATLAGSGPLKTLALGQDLFAYGQAQHVQLHTLHLTHNQHSSFQFHISASLFIVMLL